MDTTHLCKLCLRSFPNGWALGGHMRSHSLPPLRQLLWSHDSAEGGTGLRFQNYGLRENPRRSIRSADPEDYEDGSASVLVQDHESETESSRNLRRRRSKRARRSFPPRELKSRLPVLDKEKLSWVKVGDSSEPASSISEETSEEDVAFCLMLLSRDRWKNDTGIVGECRDEKGFGVDDEEEEDDGTEEDEYFDEASQSDDGAEVKSGSRKRTNRDGGKYRCETCNKFFGSYQAFGGHRASHKKARLSMSTARAEQEESTNKHNNNNNADSGGGSNKVHECPFCDRVFASGQALGGHKRSHASKSNYYAATSRTTTTSARDSPRGTIDLNMPAPAEDESSRVEFGG